MLQVKGLKKLRKDYRAGDSPLVEGYKEMAEENLKLAEDIFPLVKEMWLDWRLIRIKGATWEGR